jgi:hypothetical protein
MASNTLSPIQTFITNIEDLCCIIVIKFLTPAIQETVIEEFTPIYYKVLQENLCLTS